MLIGRAGRSFIALLWDSSRRLYNAHRLSEKLIASGGEKHLEALP